MADLAPIKERLAKCIRLFGSAERANARVMTERALNSVGANWTDLGDWVEHSYSENEMLEMVATVRAEGVEAGIKIGLTRASNGGNTGRLTLPKPFEMAQYCHDRLGQMKDDKQRNFVSDVYVITQRGMRLSLGRLGYLASIYIQSGGKT